MLAMTPSSLRTFPSEATPSEEDGFGVEPKPAREAGALPSHFKAPH